MRITAITDDRLTIEDRPWVLSLALAAVAFAATALAIKGYIEVNRVWVWSGAIGAALSMSLMLTHVERVRVVFDRREDRITLSRRAWRRRQSDSFALSDLVAAGLETHHETEGPRHRVQLHLEGRPEGIKLTRTLGGGPKSARIVAQINDWLAGRPRGAA